MHSKTLAEALKSARRPENIKELRKTMRDLNYIIMELKLEERRALGTELLGKLPLQSVALVWKGKEKNYVEGMPELGTGGSPLMEISKQAVVGSLAEHAPRLRRIK